MREKQLRVVLTFYTTADAMAAEQLCKKRAIPGRLISAPRSLSADCGIAWSGPPETREALEQAVKDSGLELHGIHELMI